LQPGPIFRRAVQGVEIPWRQLAGPMWLGQDLLKHERVDVHHAVLQQMQAEHGDLVILAAVGQGAGRRGDALLQEEFAHMLVGGGSRLLQQPFE